MYAPDSQRLCDRRLHRRLKRSTVRSFRVVDAFQELDPEALRSESAQTIFKRRRPNQVALSAARGLYAVFDHIRMPDAAGYPPLLVQLGSFGLDFSWTTQRKDAFADVGNSLRKSRASTA